MGHDDRESFSQAIRTMSMAEIVRLQGDLSQELKRRFEKELALGFSDIVGSTRYFARFGDEAGRQLLQRHFDLLQQVLGVSDGRIVDTAGDGAFVVFPTAEAAAGAFINLQKEISRDNLARPREHQLEVRLGLHFGPVLTDGQQVTGEAVNLASRVAASAAPGEIRLTRAVFCEFSTMSHRLSSRPIGAENLKGVDEPVDLLTLEWRDQKVFPDLVRVIETGQEIKLPMKDTIGFGRLGEHSGGLANDVVLELADVRETLKISRWHFELRRRDDGFRLHQVSDQLTEVNGVAVTKGTDVPIKPGSVVRVARAATLEFASDAPASTLATMKIS